MTYHRRKRCRGKRETFYVAVLAFTSSAAGQRQARCCRPGDFHCNVPGPIGGMGYRVISNPEANLMGRNFAPRPKVVGRHIQSVHEAKWEVQSAGRISVHLFCALLRIGRSAANRRYQGARRSLGSRRKRSVATAGLDWPPQYRFRWRPSGKSPRAKSTRDASSARWVDENYGRATKIAGSS